MHDFRNWDGSCAKPVEFTPEQGQNSSFFRISCKWHGGCLEHVFLFWFIFQKCSNFNLKVVTQLRSLLTKLLCCSKNKVSPFLAHLVNTWTFHKAWLTQWLFQNPISVKCSKTCQKQLCALLLYFCALNCLTEQKAGTKWYFCGKNNHVRDLYLRNTEGSKFRPILAKIRLFSKTFSNIFW